MTPKQHVEEEARLVALCRALQSDIANPIGLQQSIERDEARIKALTEGVEAARRRAAMLPELLRDAQERLRKHRLTKPHLESKVSKLVKLQEMIDALKRELEQSPEDS